MKSLYPLVFALFIAFLCSCSLQHHTKQGSLHADSENLEKMREMRTGMLADPKTGKIPDHMRQKELDFASTLPVQQEPFNKTGGAYWQQRGPWNVGGRTRAVAIDVSNENTIIIGAACGGIYRSDDGGTSWTKITGPAQDFSITCIVQDQRPGKTNIWFAGTGEFLGTGQVIGGDGILKSTDGGHTFFKLASTSYNEPQNYNHRFDYINSIAIDEKDTGEHVFVATSGDTGNIFHSLDGGQTWASVKGTLSNSPFNEVSISKTGVVYITRSSPNYGLNQQGIFRSADGINFTDITPWFFNGSLNRVVIGIDPNDENTVYFLVDGYDTMYNLIAGLWKYRYLSGTGSGAGGNWQDLSVNIPQANFDFQGGYNMVVKVKPGDSKTVFIGATNLFRSNDSFSSPYDTSRIGGYDYNLYSLQYPGHHCDEHNLFFYPSNPDRMLSTHDGGISRTENNSADPVKWASLNNGYMTTQFYTVGIDHATPGDDEVIGGMQDNGTYMTRSTDIFVPWKLTLGGDGFYCPIANGHQDYYISDGNNYHVKLDTNGFPVQFQRIDPPFVYSGNFLTHYLLDPNDNKKMVYLGDHVFRNSDITGIPLLTGSIYGDTARSPTGWDSIKNPSDTFVYYSFIAMANGPLERLAIGDVYGHLFLVDSVWASEPKMKEITSKLFPDSAYIGCIAFNPQNANEFIVVFTNYNVKSLFHTIDGGQTWEDISANLEQFPDGTGNGPSCSTAAIMPVGNHFAYLIGTSTGLYGTDTLKGDHTVWALQSPNEIGNDIVSMIDTRPSDGFVAVATYGNGIYSGHIQNAWLVSGIQGGPDNQKNFIEVYPNPLKTGSLLHLKMQNLNIQNSTGQVFDEDGKLVCGVNYNLINENEADINLPVLLPGVYYFRMTGEEISLSKMFVVEK